MASTEDPGAFGAQIEGTLLSPRRQGRFAAQHVIGKADRRKSGD